MSKALEIKNLTVEYNNITALKNINLSFDTGEYVGVIGPNGGGKTTLLKSVIGLIPVTEGTVKIFGKSDWRKKSKIGYVPQFATLNKNFPITVFEAVLSARLKGGLSLFSSFSKEDKVFVKDQLEMVGISALADRQISELSGGEMQRALIARALATGPDILFLDEPTASVDVKSKENIYNLLKQLNEKITIVLVSHDIDGIIPDVSSLVCINQEVVYCGKPDNADSVQKNMFGTHISLTHNDNVQNYVLKKSGELK